MTGTGGIVEFGGQAFPVLSWDIIRPASILDYAKVSQSTPVQAFTHVPVEVVIDLGIPFYGESLASTLFREFRDRGCLKFRRIILRPMSDAFHPRFLAELKRTYRRAKRKPRMRMLNRRK